MKIAVISRRDSPNTLDLIDAATKYGLESTVYPLGDLAINVEQLDTSDFFSHDVYLVRGYNKNLVVAQAITRLLVERGKRVIDSKIAEGHIPTKFYEALVYKRQGVAHIPTYVAGNSAAWKALDVTLTFPVVIKDVASQKGKGVRLCHSEDELLAEIDQNGFNILVQDFVSIEFDIRVLCIGDKVIGAIKRESAGNDFRTNVSLGGIATPYTLSGKEKELALQAHRSMGYEISGVDIAYGKSGEPFIIETNIAPEWQGFGQATGIAVAEKIIDYILE